MSEQLENAVRLYKLVSAVSVFDKTAAKFIASYALGYMENKLYEMPDIKFQAWAHDIDTFCTWKLTPQGHEYWAELHSKVGSI